MTKFIRHHLTTATLVALTLLAPVSLTPVRALVEFPSGRISLQASATGTYDSYMIGTQNRGDDYYATFVPRLSYDHLIGPTQLNIYGAVSMIRYMNNPQFNANDLSAGISSSLPVVEGSRLSGRFGASYNESTQIDPIVNDRIPTKNYQFDFSAGYRTGLKTSLTDSVNYSRNEREIYGNQTIWSNNLGFTYSDFLEDTNLTLTHGYTRTKSTASDYSKFIDPELAGNIPRSDLNQNANSLNVGVAHPVYGQIIGEASYGYMVIHRGASETIGGETTQKSSVYTFNLTGPLLPPTRFPKIESSATLSYSQSQSPGINDTGNKTLTGNARLAWNARERTRVSLGASRSTSLGANNFSLDTTQVDFGVLENIGLATSLNFTASYVWRTFRGINRHDNDINAGVSLNHSLTKHWSVGANYTYQNNNTNTPASSFQAVRYQLDDYTRHVVSLSVTGSY